MQPKALPSPNGLGADATKGLLAKPHFRALEHSAELWHKTFMAKLHNPGLGFVISLKACEEFILCFQRPH